MPTHITGHEVRRLIRGDVAYAWGHTHVDWTLHHRVSYSDERIA